ncbi:SusE domain-containing protein [Hymenobacter cellulosilyticus]|uniref:SusE domain-containing protein n=1 Tax=Hymenobacter cellulosilyticus TaxID=2932248 RepID=A0A8T9Q3A9_9BACT|nr:SusE domain-containing protein [Hymenobacter cellulosilyticus]UOQ70290.1 SusE domain-containing protein [Hymenobacter cellulosilyticus]
MKNWLTRIVGLCAAVVLMSSCEKDEVKVTAEPGSAPVLTASATTVALQKEDADKTAVTYSWTPITLSFSEGGYPATMTYTLQFAKKGTNFATTKDVDVSGAVRKAFTVSEVNALFKDLGFTVGQPAQVDVRLKSSYAANVPAYITALASLSGTPYESRELPALVWGLIGPAGKGWDTDVVMNYDYDKKVWTLTTDMKADFFKFRANKAWTNNLGADGPDGSLKQDGADIKLAEAGNYTITLDYNATPKPTYTMKKN